MAVQIEPAFTITLNGGPAWEVSGDQLKTVGDLRFVKLRSHDQPLIRLICNDFVELPKRTRFSLNHCAGLRELIALRNQAATNAATREEAPNENADQVANLFGADSEPASKKQKHRVNAAQLAEWRASPEHLEVMVPDIEAGEDGGLMVTMLKPVHPCDDLMIALDSDSIHCVIRFIRNAGVDIESLTQTRAYNANAGVWKNGSAGLIKKLDTDRDTDDGKVGLKKYRSMNKRRAAAPLDDEPESVHASEDEG